MVEEVLRQVLEFLQAHNPTSGYLTGHPSPDAGMGRVVKLLRCSSRKEAEFSSDAKVSESEFTDSE